MKLNVKIEFEIEGDARLDEDEIKEMVHSYLAEAIEVDELDFTAEEVEDEETH